MTALRTEEKVSDDTMLIDIHISAEEDGRIDDFSYLIQEIVKTPGSSPQA